MSAGGASASIAKSIRKGKAGTEVFVPLDDYGQLSHEARAEIEEALNNARAELLPPGGAGAAGAAAEPPRAGWRVEDMLAAATTLIGEGGVEFKAVCGVFPATNIKVGRRILRRRVQFDGMATLLVVRPDVLNLQELKPEHRGPSQQTTRAVLTDYINSNPHDEYPVSEEVGEDTISAIAAFKHRSLIDPTAPESGMLYAELEDLFEYESPSVAAAIVSCHGEQLVVSPDNSYVDGESMMSARPVTMQHKDALTTQPNNLQLIHQLTSFDPSLRKGDPLNGAPWQPGGFANELGSRDEIPLMVSLEPPSDPITMATLVANFLDLEFLTRDIVGAANVVGRSLSPEFAPLSLDDLHGFFSILLDASLTTGTLDKMWGGGAPSNTTSFSNVMPRKRYREVKMALSGAVQGYDTCIQGDQFVPRRVDDQFRYAVFESRLLPLYAAFNERMLAVLPRPGRVLVLDEVLVPFTGRRMESVAKFKVPHPSLGRGVRTVTDAATGVVLRVDPVANFLLSREFEAETGHTAPACAAALRLTKPWHLSLRCVVADSWFGSVRLLHALHKYGLPAILRIRRRGEDWPLFYPRTFSAVLGPLDVGAYAAYHCYVKNIFEAAVNQVPMMACAVKDGNSVSCFLSSMSTVRPARVNARTWIRSAKRFVTVPVPLVARDYLDARTAVDYHHHVSFGESSLVNRIGSGTCSGMRELAWIIQTLATNMYLLISFYQKQESSRLAPELQAIGDYSSFVRALAETLRNYGKDGGEAGGDGASGVGVGAGASGDRGAAGPAGSGGSAGGRPGRPRGNGRSSRSSGAKAGRASGGGRRGSASASGGGAGGAGSSGSAARRASVEATEAIASEHHLVTISRKRSREELEAGGGGNPLDPTAPALPATKKVRRRCRFCPPDRGPDGKSRGKPKVGTACACNPDQALCETHYVTHLISETLSVAGLPANFVPPSGSSGVSGRGSGASGTSGGAVPASASGSSVPPTTISASMHGAMTTSVSAGGPATVASPVTNPVGSPRAPVSRPLPGPAATTTAATTATAAAAAAGPSSGTVGQVGGGGHGQVGQHPGQHGGQHTQHTQHLTHGPPPPGSSHAHPAAIPTGAGGGHPVPTTTTTTTTAGGSTGPSAGPPGRVVQGPPLSGPPVPHVSHTPGVSVAPPGAPTTAGGPPSNTMTTAAGTGNEGAAGSGQLPPPGGPALPPSSARPAVVATMAEPVPPPPQAPPAAPIATPTTTHRPPL